MHKTDLPQYAIDGALRRRGCAHIYDQLDSARTALVVIDMQNMFLEVGAPAEVPIAREIVPNINRLAASLRDAGGTVVWVQMTQTNDNLSDWSVYYDGVSTEERAAKCLEWLTEGSHGHAIWPELEVQGGDLISLKDRYSAFLPGASDIEQQLRARDIDTVLITGTVTNVCCESSARDAMMRNFKVLMVSDGNATFRDEEHLATLASIYQVFGDVMTTDEVISRLSAARQPQAAE